MSTWRLKNKGKFLQLHSKFGSFMSLLTCNIKNSVPKNIVEQQQATLVNTMYEDEPCTPTLPGRCVNKNIRRSKIPCRNTRQAEISKHL